MGRSLAKARRVGGSLMITIPKEVVEQEDIHDGELVEVEVKKAKKSWFGIDPALGPMTREDELDAHP
jgi:antitoxin component of MazEF toxin-antitoxin module